MDTNNKLNLIDKLVLLALDDEKGNFVSDSIPFGYCLAAAAFFELTIEERIQILDEKVKVSNTQTLNDGALDYCLEIMAASKKERKAKRWIERIGNKASVIRKKTLNKLISLEILEEKEDKILWVFTNRKYPSTNDLPEHTLRKRLHDIVLDDAKPEMDEIMIISLVDACGLNKEVYGKETAKEKKKKIKSIIEEYEFADSTGKLIKELHETIMAVLITVITTSTVTATVSS